MLEIPCADEAGVSVLWEGGDKEEDKDEDDEELARVIGTEERLLGGGAQNVSTGFVQSADPSSFLPQQCQIWLWLS